MPAGRTTWLMLLYQLPARPSTQRVYVWRRLKTLGVVYLQNSVCVLPEAAAFRQQLEELRGEIEARSGEARLLPITLAEAKEDAQMRDLFRRQSEEDYEEVLGKCRDFHAELRKERAAHHFTFAELEENEEELAKIEAWLAKVTKRDFFGGRTRGKAARGVAAGRRDLDRYRLEVADAQGVSPPRERRQRRRPAARVELPAPRSPGIVKRDKAMKLARHPARG